MTGAKVFSVFWSGRWPLLYSPATGVDWRYPRKYAKLFKKKVTPGSSGIHAYRLLRDAVGAQTDTDQHDHHPARDAVYAIVVPEGRTVIGEIGWAAERAVIRQIYLPTHLYAAYSRGLY